LLLGAYEAAPYSYWLQTNNDNSGTGFPLVLNPLGGSVGIGTSAPTAQLHTTGSVRFQGFGAGTLVTDASGNVSVRTGAGLGVPGEHTYYKPIAATIAVLGTAGGPDAIDLTAEIAAAGLNVAGVTVKAAYVRVDVRLGSGPFGVYSADAWTSVSGDPANMDGLTALAIYSANDSTASAADRVIGMCQIITPNTIYWSRAVSGNASGESHGVVLLGFQYVVN
jgi:hypothetical protein